MRRQKWLLLMLWVGVSALAACNFGPAPQNTATPTLQIAPPTRLQASLTPNSTLPPAPAIASPTLTFTPAPPTATFTPSPTPGPIEYTIKEGDQLISIIRDFGYRDLSVIDEIVRINENIPDADTLPGPGAVILIPRPTDTPTPEGAEVTPTAPILTGAGLGAGTAIVDYVVQENDSMVGIAQMHSTTLEVLAQLNPEIPFFGCDFNILSGGPDCNPPLQIGQVVRVPAPTPTPTLSPTPSGSETPTPTPTFTAPMVSFPPNGATAEAGVFRLQWVSVGVLRPGEYYLVEITDAVTGEKFTDITKHTSYWLPESLIPSDGQTHLMQWTVSVAAPNASGAYQIVSAPPEVRTFKWQSR